MRITYRIFVMTSTSSLSPTPPSFDNMAVNNLNWPGIPRSEFIHLVNESLCDLPAELTKASLLVGISVDNKTFYLKMGKRLADEARRIFALADTVVPVVELSGANPQPLVGSPAFDSVKVFLGNVTNSRVLETLDILLDPLQRAKRSSLAEAIPKVIPLIPKIGDELIENTLSRVLAKTPPTVRVCLAPVAVPLPPSYGLMKERSYQAMIEFTLWSAKVDQFEEEAAENGITLAAVARRVINSCTTGVVAAIFAQTAKSFADIREVLLFIKEEIFQKTLEDGLQVTAFSPVAANADVTIVTAELCHILAFFPNTSVKRAKEILLARFKGWPLAASLQHLELAASATSRGSLTFGEMVKAANRAALLPDSRPKQVVEAHNTEAIFGKKSCAICRAPFVPTLPHHAKCTACFSKGKSGGSASNRDTCRGCKAPWSGKTTVHEKDCKYFK